MRTVNLRCRHCGNIRSTTDLEAERDALKAQIASATERLVATQKYFEDRNLGQNAEILYAANDLFLKSIGWKP